MYLNGKQIYGICLTDKRFIKINQRFNTAAISIFVEALKHEMAFSFFFLNFIYYIFKEQFSSQLQQINHFGSNLHLLKHSMSIYRIIFPIARVEH